MPYCHVAPEDLELLGIFSRLAKGHDPYSLLHTSKVHENGRSILLVGRCPRFFSGSFLAS